MALYYNGYTNEHTFMFPELIQKYVCNKLSKSLIATDSCAKSSYHHVWGSFECNLNNFKL